MAQALPAELAHLGPAVGLLESNGITSAAVYPLPDDLVDIPGWARRHRAEMRAALARFGVVLLRNVTVDVDLFGQIAAAVGGDPLPYRDRSTPRSHVDGNIYTSTEYPADQRIPLHNENSYADVWPAMLFFLCAEPARHGGATPVADSRAVFGRIDADIRTRFAGGIVYTRTYRDDVGLGWQEAFQTDSRSEVEEYCARHGQHCEWDGPVLRTRFHRPAWRAEASSGSPVWFNQAHLFHVSALDAEIREALLLSYPDRDLPRNAYHGDGSPLSADDLGRIDEVYRECALTIPWRRGDLMVVDNMVAAHGRMPYRGPRSVLVAMT
ncbi:TauD/TfdA family dioxygenase [Nocardia sp. NBC_00565]|uniref:TauD/TfdA family dioxygenase n=1 Tax=Nocardia sp. NBC_00565 TaxID=2975993 RepID=UPI002E80C606|nr:TauD/TfdA family dioxygenase [Nocardia sp. NBC_00565]WUC04020.1 TauD/TfdA family dioxygenase [Nocardia sp. NBC_00565]